MTFGDMVRKKENIIVKASDLEAEVANDPCQSSENSSLDGFEPSTATLIEIRGSMEIRQLQVLHPKHQQWKLVHHH